MKRVILCTLLLGLVWWGPGGRTADAQTTFNLSLGQTQAGTGPGFQVSVNDHGGERDLNGLLKILVMFTVITLAPAILIMCTSFTRILIVLTFLRQAIGVQHIPPNQILIAITLFLTAFNMMPVWNEIQTQVVKPYQAGELAWEDVVTKGAEPVRIFMLKHTRPKDMSLFLKLARQPKPQNHTEISFFTLIPAFIVSELKVAFQIGFLLYLPFIVVDMVVASILLSMGMMMLPPIMVSLPFKILLFVMVDGWNLLISSLLKSFY